MSTAGPNFPSSVSGAGWTNTSNIIAADSAFATDGLAALTTSNNLIGQGFGFAIPAGSTINGITLEINQKASAGTDVAEVTVKLLKAGVAAGSNKAVNTLTTTATTYTFGGSADLWGTTWTATDINSATFGAEASYINNNGSLTRTVSVDFYRITVTYTTPAGAKMFQVF